MRLRFGDCVLDTETHELLRAGQPVALSPKAFLVLATLAERRPRVLSSPELRAVVWPGTVVGGTTVARLINEVRSAIGDRGRPPRLVRTVARVGYAFSGDVIEERDRPRPGSACGVQWGTRQVRLAEGENVIGRTADAHISLPASGVSRRHARIVVANGRAILEDLGSKNGTYLCDRKLEGPSELRHGDQIVVGSVMLIFRMSAAEETTSTGVRA